METMDLRQGDCLTLMKSIPDKSVDLMICDLPYGETNCKWDTCINLEEFWKEFKRIRKSKRTLCIHFCSTKFGYTLIKSWESGFKMDMVWKKRNKTGGLQSRYRPMRNHEMVYFFYEQTPKYNRDKYHKRIQEAKIDKTDGKNEHGFEKNIESGLGRKHQTNFEPVQPGSVIEDAESNKLWGYNKPDTFSIGKNGKSQAFDPPNPVSVLEEEEKNYMGKTKQQVLNSRSENGKNHKHTFEPPNPGSVLEDEESDIYGETKSGMKARGKGHYHAFEPPNPSSVIEDTTCYGIDKKVAEKSGNPIGVIGAGYEPKLPTSVIEETTTNGITKEKCLKSRKSKFAENGYEPPNPGSIVEEKNQVYGKACGGGFTGKNGYGEYEPPNPGSVFDSQKVFIGKRNHQTEKPQDILEFFLKYWSDEGETILDPTMGSGSTGVACKKMGRKFIGFELDEKIFKKAQDRINVD